MATRTKGRADLLDVLEKLRPGDEIRLAQAARATGLDEGTCESVFEALVRVGLFTRADDGVFVRRRMLEGLDAGDT